MQLENLCTTTKDASDARKILHATTKTPDSQINKYLKKKTADAEGDGQVPRRWIGTSAKWSTSQVCSRPMCSSSDSWGKHRPWRLGLPLSCCIPQVLVSGEHLTAEAPGDGIAPRFITPRTCFYICIYILFFFFFNMLDPCCYTGFL